METPSGADIIYHTNVTKILKKMWIETWSEETIPIPLTITSKRKAREFRKVNLSTLEKRIESYWRKWKETSITSSET